MRKFFACMASAVIVGLTVVPCAHAQAKREKPALPSEWAISVRSVFHGTAVKSVSHLITPEPAALPQGVVHHVEGLEIEPSDIEQYTPQLTPRPRQTAPAPAPSPSLPSV